MRGSITRRGKSSWRIKFELAAVGGKRRFHLETVKAPSRRHKLPWPSGSSSSARIVTSRRPPRRSRPTLSTGSRTSRRPRGRKYSVYRYSQLLRSRIIPELGAIELQKLDGTAIDKFYAGLARKAPLTRRAVHAVLRMILASAVRAKKLSRSPIIDVETAPKTQRRDKIEVLDEAELAKLLGHLRGHWLYVPALACCKHRHAPR